MDARVINYSKGQEKKEKELAKTLGWSIEWGRGVWCHKQQQPQQ